MPTSPIDEIESTTTDRSRPVHLEHRDAPDVVPLFVDITSIPRGVRVVFSGEIDCETAPQFRQSLDEAAADNAVVEVDLDQVSFMDSSGLCVLVGICNSAGPATIRVVAASSRVARLIDITGLSGAVGLTPPGDRERSVLADLVAEVHGCTSASVLRIHRGVPTTEIATDDVARAADAAQIDCDSGPSLAALRRGEVVELTRVVAGPGRYEEFRSAAASLRIENVVAIPVRTGDATLVAVTLYGNRPGGLALHETGPTITDAMSSLGWTVAGQLSPS